VEVEAGERGGKGGLLRSFEAAAVFFGPKARREGKGSRQRVHSFCASLDVVDIVEGNEAKWEAGLVCSGRDDGDGHSLARSRVGGRDSSPLLLFFR